MTNPLVLRDTYGLLIKPSGFIDRMEAKPSFQAIRALVGGYIETLPAKWEGFDWQMCFDEEGKLKNLPLNTKASDIVGIKIVGPVVLLRGKYKLT